MRHIEDKVREILNSATDGTIRTDGSYGYTAETDVPANTDVASNRLLNQALIEQAFGTPPDIEQFRWAASIPRGWAWVRMDQLAEIKLGRMRSPKQESGDHMRPYLRVANVLEDRIDTTKILEMNFTPEEYEIYALRPGDVLLNEGQSPELVGRPAVYHGEVPGACYQNHILRFRSNGAVDPEYAVLVFRSYLHAGRFQAIARWTTNLATLSLKRFSAMPFPLPPLDAQRAIIIAAREQLNDAEEQRNSANAALARLPDLEREFLSMAVSGVLVDNRTDCESAAQALERLGPPPVQKSASEHSQARTVAEKTIQPEAAPRGDTHPSRLEAALESTGTPLPLPGLFLAAGFDKDSSQDIEDFYVELRANYGRSIRKLGNSEENSLLEVVTNANN
jgi:Type I restriction modification DNA specificity domain